MLDSAANRGSQSRPLYDYVYFPRSANLQKNLGMAFVNFVDHASAALALRVLQSSGWPAAENCGKPMLISFAEQQGLGPNLAYFVARLGMHNLNHVNGPIAFRNNLRVEDLLSFVNENVSCHMMWNAEKAVAKESMDRMNLGDDAGQSSCSTGSGRSSSSTQSSDDAGITMQHTEHQCEATALGAIDPILQAGHKFQKQEELPVLLNPGTLRSVFSGLNYDGVGDAAAIVSDSWSGGCSFKVVPIQGAQVLSL